VITIFINDSGIYSIRLPQGADAETLLRKRELLERITPQLRQLDNAIKIAVPQSNQ
jgi:hypothetical protein